MSGLAALSGLAQGLGAGLDMRQRRKEKLAEDARQDALIAAYGRMPMGLPGRDGAEGTGYGGGMRGPGGGGQPTGGADTGGDGTLLGLLDKTEGGANYDTLFGHSQNGGRFNGVKVSDMTLAELSEFQSPSGEYGRWVQQANPEGVLATPAGRFQIVGTTARRTAEQMGLSPDTRFTPAVQVSMAEHLARNRLSGASSPAAKRAQMRAEWAGFKNVPDDVLDQAIAGFEANGGYFYPRARGVSRVSGTPM